MNNNITKVLVSCLLVAGMYLFAAHEAAHADPKTGIYWLSDTSADGVHVRRLEDTTYGTICYVAKADTGGGSYPSVSISCIKAKP